MLIRGSDSTHKILSILGMVAKIPIEFEMTKTTPPDVVEVSRAFFREMSCYGMCGGCCRQWTLDYLPEESTHFCNYYPDIDVVRRDIIVNNQAYPIVTLSGPVPPVARGITWCSYFDPDEGNCQIHLMNPLSCQMPLITVRNYSRDGKTYAVLTKSPFGRGWNMVHYGSKWDHLRGSDRGVPCQQLGSFSEKQFFENDLPTLARLCRWAEYFQIPTYLPDLIQGVTLAHSMNIFETIQITGVH
jgi:hypothetical protein